MRRAFTSSGASSALQGLTTPTDGDGLFAGGGRYARLAKGSSRDMQLGTGPVTGNVGYYRPPHTRPNDLALLAVSHQGLPNNGLVALTAGTMLLVRVPVSEVTPVTGIYLLIDNPGATLTANQCFATIYDAATKALIGITGDRSTAWQSGGPDSAALTGGPFTVSADVWIGLWAQGTTMPQFATSSGAQAGTAVSGKTTGNALLAATGATGLTTSGTAPATLGTLTASSKTLVIGLY